MHHGKCTSVLTEEKFEEEQTIDKTTNVKKNRRKKLKTREEKLETGDQRLETICHCKMLVPCSTLTLMWTLQEYYLVKHKEAQQKLPSVMKLRKEAFKDDEAKKKQMLPIFNKLVQNFSNYFYCMPLFPTQPNETKVAVDSIVMITFLISNVVLTAPQCCFRIFLIISVNQYWVPFFFPLTNIEWQFPFR